MLALAGRCTMLHMGAEQACVQAVTSNGAANGICNQNLQGFSGLNP